jgi:RNA polymerase sigma-B factor
MSSPLAPVCSDSLLRRYAAERDPADRDEVFRRFRPLARRLALRYARGAEPIDDLEQVACLGLLKAMERFDPDRGFAFTSFAVPTILGELRRSFRDTAWAAHVPRSLQERVADVRAHADGWVGRYGRTPTVGELAGALGCDEEEIVDALQAAAALTTVSLEATGGGSDEDEGATLGERLGDDDPAFDLIDDRVALASALPSLTGVQREVLRLRFEEELKQSEIAEHIGVSQMQISRVLRAAIHRLSMVANHQSGDDLLAS